MIVLEGLSCSREPPLQGISLSLSPGELPAVVGPSAEERAALVELLAGYRAESAGRFVLDGKPLAPRARRTAVVVLPHRAALTADLSVAEHLRLVGRLRGARLDEAVQDRLLQFARVERASLRPDELDEASRLRLTVGLAVVGRPALVVALDPPPEISALLVELLAPDRAVLLVAPNMHGVELHVSRMVLLQGGRLGADVQAQPERAQQVFVLHVSHGGPVLEARLATQAGVELDRLGEGVYRLRASGAVALAPLIRGLVAAGVALESVRLQAERRA